MPPVKNKPIEVYSVLVNTVHYYDSKEIRVRQLVFLNEDGYSLGYYLFDKEEDYKVFKRDKLLFLRNDDIKVRYKVWLNKKMTYEDYEVKMRKQSVKRLIQ